MDEESINERHAFEQWASNILIIKSKEGAAYILDGDIDSSFEIENTANLTLRSSNLKMDFQIISSVSDSKIEIKFLPPWKHSSPLPPASIKGCENEESPILSLLVAADLQPCQKIFQMPFGRLMKEFQSEIYILPDTKQFVYKPGGEKPSGKNIDNEGASRDSVESLPVGNSGQKPENQKITVKNCVLENSDSPDSKNIRTCSGLSQIDINDETYGVSLSLTKISLSYGFIILFVALAWFLFCGGLLLIYLRVDSNRLWTLNGVMLALWCLLVFRLLSSLRHSLNQDLLDRLVISGIVSNLVILTIIPGMLFLVARVYSTAYPRQANKKISDLRVFM